MVTVPYRVFPGGEDGVDYTKYVALDSLNDGHNWANWILEILPEGGTVLMLSGPPGNSQGVREAEGLHEILDPTGLYTFIGEQPFEPTGWDPAVTQQVLTAAIASNPEIDVIVSDFGPSLVGALPEFENSGRSIPPIATSDGNLLGCFWAGEVAGQPRLQADDHPNRKRSFAFGDPMGRRPRYWRCDACRELTPAPGVRELGDRRSQPGPVRARPSGRRIPLGGDVRRGPGRIDGLAISRQTTSSDGDPRDSRVPIALF